jgi:hypothetical protein
MLCAIVSFLLGVAGWLVTNFFAKPFLDFLILRGQVHEEILFTANIGQMSRVAPCEAARDSLRRLGAKLEATNTTASPPLRWFFSKCGYDLAGASAGLIGLSISLEEPPHKAIHTNKIQVGLKLPRDYLDEYLEAVRRQIQNPQY